jgi:hypothetical protein
VADALGEVERRLHAQVLARLDIDVPAIRVWGDGATSTAGSAVRERLPPAHRHGARDATVYRKAERNGDTLHPVSLRAGVVAVSARA